MKHRLAIEEIEPEHWIAWALDWPGCFSAAHTADEALARAPECLANYAAWLVSKDPSLAKPADTEVELVERFEAFTAKDDPDHIVNAFFEDDRRPLNEANVAHALRLLTWTREDFLAAVNVAQAAVKDVDSIARHVASAEDWYLDRLDLALPLDQLPQAPIERLTRVRQQLRAQLPHLIGSTRIVMRSDEIWSARKLVRRALWHERDHTAYIAKLGVEAG